MIIQINKQYQFAWVWRFLFIWKDNNFSITFYDKQREDVIHNVEITWL